MKFVFIYITCSSEEEAQKIANHLLQEKIIACANIHPIKSLYWWKGKITNDNETVLLVKTLDIHYAKVVEKVEKLHNYDVPCITKIPVEPNAQYAEWLGNEVS